MVFEDIDFGFVVAAGYDGSLLLVEARFEEGFSNVPTFIDDARELLEPGVHGVAGIRFR
jgi:hypothetical protein